VNKLVRIELDQVLYLEDDDFQIITTEIEGNTTERQVKYCMIYMLAKEYMNEKMVHSKELRELCQYFDCYDSGNFANNLSERKKYFIIAGEKRSSNKQYRLTAPGKTETKNIISSLVRGN